MKQYSQLYRGIDNFKTFLKNNNFDQEQKCLVRLFTAVMGKTEIISAVQQIKEQLPNAEVVGSTSSGAVIFQSTQFEADSVVVINTFEKIKITTMCFDWEQMSPKEVLSTLKTQYTNTHSQVNVLFSNTCGKLYDILDDFVHHTNIVHPFINYVGGVAGNIDDTSNGESQVKSYVYCNDTILENGVVAFSYEAINEYTKLDFFTYTSIAADEISEFHEVTAVNGNQILSIDNVDTIEWFYKYLNVEFDEKISFDEFKKIAGDEHFSGFSVISNKHNDTSRCVLYDNKTYIVSLFSSKMSVGSKFKVGYLNPRRVLNESYMLSGKLLQSNVESIFVYSCSARKAFLKSAAALELIPLAQNDVSGVFLLGEICNKDGRNNLYNASCCLIGFSEAEHAHMHVDTTVLTNENIAGDMKYFNKAVARYNEITTDHEDTNSSKFYDPDYNIPNILKYNYDATKNIFDKITLVEVLTADSTITHVGKDEYIDTAKEFFSAIGRYTDRHNITEQLNFYVMDYKTFIITANSNIPEEKFIELMKHMHERFGFVSSKTKDVSAVNRFVVVLNQENMLKTGISALYANRSSQENFIISGQESLSQSDALANEAFYINLLKKAIDDKTVTPYYQGMHNNETNKIDKYEALMRIVDGDTVYLPDMFLEVAKKFKLYPEISKQMIEKALDQFDGSDDTISINVSLYDIESVTFRDWLISRLKTAKNPKKIVVEFVETEECKDLNLIKEFIKDVHNAGSLIAIDDFGSGYSTFSTIINLKPDLIKIDGSIISGIADNPINHNVMKTICYLAKSLNIQTIAEFVDSPKIQQLVKDSNINHSQGFLFSLPSPR